MLIYLDTETVCAPVVPGCSLAAVLADADFADMANRLADGATTGIRSALRIAQFIGVLFVIRGLIAAKIGFVE